MTEQKIDMRVGDRLPQFTARAKDNYNVPVDVTGYRAYLILAATNADTVFGYPSPWVTECSIVDAAGGVVRFDWSQAMADAAVPSVIAVRVRFVNIADPALTFEVPSGRDAFIYMRPRVDGDRVYLRTDAGTELLLDDDGNPMQAA